MFDARDKIGIVRCHLCVSKEMPSFIEIEELQLSHLEEFICWADNAKIIDTTLEISGTQ